MSPPCSHPCHCSAKSTHPKRRSPSVSKPMDASPNAQSAAAQRRLLFRPLRRRRYKRTPRPDSARRRPEAVTDPNFTREPGRRRVCRGHRVCSRHVGVALPCVERLQQRQDHPLQIRARPLGLRGRVMGRVPGLANTRATGAGDPSSVGLRGRGSGLAASATGADGAEPKSSGEGRRAARMEQLHRLETAGATPAGCSSRGSSSSNSSSHWSAGARGGMLLLLQRFKLWSCTVENRSSCSRAIEAAASAAAGAAERWQLVSDCRRPGANP